MTICDIARLAGVSVTTVSRVINHSGYVKEETRRRIEDLIREYNYRPNAVARSLIRNDTSMIAVIMPGRTNPFFMEILDAIEETAEVYGHSVLFYNTGENPERERWAIEQAIEHRVIGILLLPIMRTRQESVQLLKEAEQADIPVILVDRELPEPCFDAVLLDNRQAVYEGTQLLIESGHRKIALISCPEVSAQGRTRLEGYLSCLQKYGITVRPDYIQHGNFDEESGYLACQYFRELQDPPTAILASCSSVTLGCIRYVNEKKLHLGIDLALVGLDDIATLKAIGYPITVIDRLRREMGIKAYQLLMGRINKTIQTEKKREVLMHARLIRRGSEGVTDEFATEQNQLVL